MPNTWTRKEVARITGLSDRRVLFYTEQNVLPLFTVAVGRGTAREYSRRDIFYLMLLQELQDLGLSLSKIRLIIMALHIKTFRFTGGPPPPMAGPSIWKDGTLAEGPFIIVISLPQGPEEHHLSPDAKGYDSEVFLQVFAGSPEITVLADRPSKIVINLNQVFSKAAL
jgi:hypothetical protein